MHDHLPSHAEGCGASPFAFLCPGQSQFMALPRRVSFAAFINTRWLFMRYMEESSSDKAFL